MVIIYIKFIVLEMLHIKFYGNRPSDSGEDF